MVHIEACPRSTPQPLQHARGLLKRGPPRRLRAETPLADPAGARARRTCQHAGAGCRPIGVQPSHPPNPSGTLPSVSAAQHEGAPRTAWVMDECPASPSSCLQQGMLPAPHRARCACTHACMAARAHSASSGRQPGGKCSLWPRSVMASMIWLAIMPSQAHLPTTISYSSTPNEYTSAACMHTAHSSSLSEGQEQRNHVVGLSLVQSIRYAGGLPRGRALAMLEAFAGTRTLAGGRAEQLTLLMMPSLSTCVQRHHRKQLRIRFLAAVLSRPVA